ncbi:MAG: CHAT domain-containing protein, partial [Synechococcales bacterium]|nr:CHAT domain-containing protein [Synechococcales bacterium]
AKTANNPWFEVDVLTLIGFDRLFQANREKQQNKAYDKAEQQLQQAETHFRQAIALATTIPAPAKVKAAWQGVVQQFLHLGFVYDEQSRVAENKRDYPQANQFTLKFQQVSEKARDIAQNQMGDPVAEGTALGNMAQAWMRRGQIAYTAGQYAEELTYQLTGLELAQQGLERMQQGKPNPSTLKNAKDFVALAHFLMLSAYNSNEQYEKAIAFGQTARLAAKAADNKNFEQGIDRILHNTYLFISTREKDQRRYPEAIAAAQTAIEYAKLIQEPTYEVSYRVNLIAISYLAQGQFEQALKEATLGHDRAREISDPSKMISAMNMMASAHEKLGNYREALDLYQQALKIQKTSGGNVHTGTSLGNIGAIYGNLGDYQQAQNYVQRSFEINQRYWQLYQAGITPKTIGVLCEFYPHLQNKVSCKDPNQLPTGTDLKLFQQVGDGLRNLGHIGMGVDSMNMAAFARLQGNFRKGLELNQQALAIFTERQDTDRIASSFTALAATHIDLGNYEQALDLAQKALEIAKKNRNLQAELDYSELLGILEHDRGNLQQARQFFDRALTLAQQLKSPLNESTLQREIANVSVTQGNYAEGLKLNRQALQQQQKMGTQPEIIKTLRSIGSVYEILGDIKQALHYHQQALAIAQKIGDRPKVMYMTLQLAETHLKAKQFDLAKSQFATALALAEAMGTQTYKSSALYGLGALELAQARPAQAIPRLEQALMLQRKIGIRAEQAMTLNLLGRAQMQQMLANSTHPDQAQTTLQEAWTIAQELGNPTIEAEVLANIAALYQQQKQPTAAIALYKQSVRIYEKIRQGLAPLPKEQQERYTASIADTYRQLADGLITQDRLVEAEQVLDLLKLQEIREFAPTRNQPRSREILLSQTEQELIQRYDSLMRFGQKLKACDGKTDTPCSQLRTEQRNLRKAFNQFLGELAEKTQKRCQQNQEQSCLQPDQFTTAANRLIQAQPGTIVVSPVVLDDKIWILVASEGGILSRYESKVDRQTLGNTVLELRSHLQDRYSDPATLQALSKQLYDWLIKPIEPVLQTSRNPKNLVFALDRVTRYIPMGVLFDGQQYLVQRYTISTVLSLESTKLQKSTIGDVGNSPVLALGLSQATSDYSALPNVESELDAIVKLTGIYPGRKFLNQEFTLSAIDDHLDNHKILHLATHGQFVPNQKNGSYLVLGNGEKMPIEEIRSFDFNNIELVVLSACETALGSPEQDGVEIPGLSSFFLNNGASTVMASLWAVDDSSTALIMQQFYQHLASGKMTKAKAIQKVQQDLITSKLTFNDIPRSAKSSHRSPSSSPQTNRSPYAHPYYWAPFILIGNSIY